MRADAKASSAGSTQRQVSGLGGGIRGAFATRGGLGRANGSGAPSHRARNTVLTLAITALALLALVPLSQAKIVVGAFGPKGTQGGQFNTTGRIAVNNSGVGVPAGTLYVADTNNNRVQRLSANGAFQRAWGFDVVTGGATGTGLLSAGSADVTSVVTTSKAFVVGQALTGTGIPAGTTITALGAGTITLSQPATADGTQTLTVAAGTGNSPVNEKQTVTLGAAVSSGNFKLTFTTANPSASSATTPNIAYNAPATDPGTPGVLDSVQEALESLSNIGAGNVSVSGSGGPAGVYTITFGGTRFADTNVEALTVAAGSPNLSGGSATVATTQEGASAFETCTVAASCQKGSAGATTANGGQLKELQGIDVSQTSGHVYVVDNGNRRVEEFDADGNFIRAWGSDVTVDGSASDPTSVKTFQICSIAADCKAAAAAGTDGGRFGNNPRHLAIDPSGNVWVADTANRRFEKFDSSGNFIAVYGYNVNGGNALESCTSTVAGVCKAGTQGSGMGQFGSAASGAFAFDSSGNVYAGDLGNKRVLRFVPTMTSATAFASLTTITADPLLLLPSDHFLVSLNQNSERELLELDSSGNPGTTSLVGSGFASINGLARNSTSGKVYAVTNNTQAAIAILDDGTVPPDPGMVLNPITTKATSTATFSATIDPQGATISGCSFQYSTDQVNWTQSFAVPSCSSLSPGGGPQPVSANATGLVPNTKYFVRLAVTRLFIGGTSLSTVRAFTTDAEAPLVSNVGAITPTDRSLRMVGTIDPRNSGQLGYVFQYGTTLALGSSTSPVTVANASSPVIVSQLVSGLAPNTTYYFRLVATNLTGTTSSPIKSFATRSNPLPLPDNRAYEQVSPVDKNGGGAQSGTFAGTTPAYAGDAIGFCTSSLFGDPAAEMTGYGHACGDYVSHRDAAGWTTTTLMPAVCNGGAREPRLSLNLEAATFAQAESASCGLPPLAPAAPMPSTNLYRSDLLGGSPTYELLNPVATGGSAPFYSGSSDDFDHVLYASAAQLTPDAPAGSFAKLYDWEQLDHGACTAASPDYRAAIEACLSLVSKDTSGSPLTTDSSAAGDNFSTQGPADADHGVSASGDRVFFQNKGSGSLDPTELYLRQGGVTYKASQSECTSSCSSVDNAARTFRYATPDGSKSFFTTAGKLTNEDTSSAGDDLYMYTHPADPIANPPATDPHNLTLLSQDNEPADGTSASVLGVSGASDDGNTVFFAASGQLVLGQPTAVGPKLYRWHYDTQTASASLNYLATLANGDSKNWQLGGFRWVTPSGQYLLSLTTVAIDPVADTDEAADFYRWDQKGGWVCASCQGPGVVSTGDAEGIGDAESMGGFHGNGRRLILMTDDGQRIFFSTADALVPADTNATGGCPGLACLDTYEWHDGALSLISTGTSPNPSYLLGVSHDGTDVFFYTTDPLVGWDGDTAGDIYDARIDGGFPEPPPTGAPCDLNAGACEGAGSTPPPDTGAGSAAFQGPGNPPATQPKPHKKHKHAKKSKKHHKRHHERAANTTRRAGR